MEAATPAAVVHLHRVRMPRYRSPLFPRIRLIAALLFVALQLGRVGVEWMDDARFAGAGPAVVHVEPMGGSGDCHSTHSLQCAICAAIATPTLPARTVDMQPLVATCVAAIPVSVIPLADATAGYLPPSRAPPLL